MGDEPLNPYLPKDALAKVTGDNLQGDVETAELYKAASEKFDIYHLNVKHGGDWYDAEIHSTYGKYLDKQHFKDTTVNKIANDIVEIVTNAFSNANVSTSAVVSSSDGISW